MGNLWLTAYALDFLQHARAAGLQVPDAMESRAATWLAGHFASTAFGPDDIAGAAYASIILSRAGKVDLSQLRYVASRVQGKLPSDLARVQLASALTHVGERGMAADILAASPVSRTPKVWLNDYGSPLRDEAMVLSLMAEEKLVPRKVLFERALSLARATGGKAYLSTQEEAWLLRAAFDLHATTPLKVVLNGTANAAGTESIHASLPLKPGTTGSLANEGREPVYVSLATTGIPAGAQTGRSQRLLDRAGVFPPRRQAGRPRRRAPER